MGSEMCIRDRSSTGLTSSINVDLLGASYVADVEGISLTGASPDFTTEQFLAHSQAKINEALNNYAVSRSTDTISGSSALGVSNQLFARAAGSKMDAILTESQIVNLKHLVSSTDTSSMPLIAEQCGYPTSAVTISPVLDNLGTKPSPTLPSSTDTASTVSGVTVTPILDHLETKPSPTDAASTASDKRRQNSKRCLLNFSQIFV